MARGQKNYGVYRSMYCVHTEHVGGTSESLERRKVPSGDERRNGFPLRLLEGKAMRTVRCLPDRGSGGTPVTR